MEIQCWAVLKKQKGSLQLEMHLPSREQLQMLKEDADWLALLTKRDA